VRARGVELVRSGESKVDRRVAVSAVRSSPRHLTRAAASLKKASALDADASSALEIPFDHPPHVGLARRGPFDVVPNLGRATRSSVCRGTARLTLVAGGRQQGEERKYEDQAHRTHRRCRPRKGNPPERLRKGGGAAPAPQRREGARLRAPFSRLDSLVGSLFVDCYTQVSVTGLVNPSASDAVQWKMRVGNGW
jgi:hypothetical protein